MKPAKSTLWARSTPAISSLILPPEIVSMSHTADTGVLTLSRAREHLVQVTQSSMPAHVSQPSELWGARCATQCCDPPRPGAARFSSLSACDGTGPGPGASRGLSSLGWVTPLCVAPPAWQGPCGHHWPRDPMWHASRDLHPGRCFVLRHWDMLPPPSCCYGMEIKVSTLRDWVSEEVWDLAELFIILQGFDVWYKNPTASPYQQNLEWVSVIESVWWVWREEEFLPNDESTIHIQAINLDARRPTLPRMRPSVTVCQW